MDGFFYVIQLVPDAYPQRLKLGFSTDPERRLGSHKTAMPTARLLGTWPCPRHAEAKAIHALTQENARHIAGEVYDVDDPEALCTMADEMFPPWNLRGFPEEAAPPPRHDPPAEQVASAFRKATDMVPLKWIAEELGVSVQSLRQARLHPESSGFRRPPRGWQRAVAAVIRARSATLSDLADQLDPGG